MFGIGQKNKTVAMPLMECGHCGYTWVARSAESPKYCPHCKQPLKKRVNKQENQPVRAGFGEGE